MGKSLTSSSRQSWYREPNVGLRKATIISIICFAVVVLLGALPAMRQIIGENAETLSFSARELVTGSPALSPQLKLVVFDDKTMAQLQASELDGFGWAKLIKAIADQRPSAIVIDQMFGVAFPDDEAAAFRAALDIGVPVTVAAFNSRYTLPGRPPLRLRPEHHASEIVKDPAESSAWIPRDFQKIYGPAASLEPHFAHVGHIERERFRFRPFVSSSEDVMVPLAPFFVGSGVAVTKDGLFVNWRHVPVGTDGTILPNFRPMRAFTKQTFSVANLLKGSDDDTVDAKIKGGDIVLIIPQFATGSTDFKDTPLGVMPGGLVIASLVNSVMTGDWLTPVGREEVFAGLGVLLGLVLALALSGRRFWTGFVAASVIVSCGGLAAFIYHGIVMPWHATLGGCLLTGCALTIEKLRVAELKAQSLRAAFAKMMAPEALKRMVKDPSRVDVAPAQRVVTVLFIDIVGFSLRSEEQEASEVFRDLKEQLGEMITLIHEHGGVVDKTLGDGILAFFGYRYDGSPTDPDHADRAVRCGMAIQRRMMARNHRQAAAGLGVSPVRIGINSEAVFIGNLGHEDRLDFTIIGHGVNFAKRLEEACEVYRIMLSETTHRMLLTQVVPKDRLRHRLVMIKHHSAPLMALELDPFYDDPETLKAGLEEYRQCSGLKKNEERIEVPRHVTLKFLSRYGEGEVADVSLSGMSVKLATYLARGMEIEFQIDSDDGALGVTLAQAQLMPLVGQVRWGAPAGDAYVHGIVIKNLSQVQKALLFKLVTTESQGIKLVA